MQHTGGPSCWRLILVKMQEDAEGCLQFDDYELILLECGVNNLGLIKYLIACLWGSSNRMKEYDCRRWKSGF